MSVGQRTSRLARRLASNSVTIGMICLGGLFIVAARSLPAARFDPLGAAPFPTALGWLMIVLGGLDLARNLVAEETVSDQRPSFAISLRAVIVLALTVLYGLSMAVFGLSFAVATILYLLLASLALGRPERSQVVVLLILFPALAVLLAYLLKGVVYVDLP